MHRSTVSILGFLVACGGAASHGAPVTSSAAERAPVLTAQEQQACGAKQGAEVDSLECLVAAYLRTSAGDAAGAKALLAYGCDHDDMDACNDLRALEPARAAELDQKIAATCTRWGDLGTKLAGCLRGRTTEVLTVKDVDAKLPVALALDLRARYGPRLLAAQDLAQRACKAAAAGTQPATLDGTRLEKDPSFLDVGINCEGIDLAAVKTSRDGETASSDYRIRSLHDGLLNDETVLRVDASTGHGKVGVYCPSQLVDDSHAADVWSAVEEGGITTTIIGTVHIDQPCRNEPALALRDKDVVALHAALAPVDRVVSDALAKLADECDGRPETFDAKKSPLAGHAIEHVAGVLSFEPHCVYGFRGFAFDSPKPLDHPNPMSSIHEFIRVDGHPMRVEVIKGRNDRFEMTFRRRNAELVVGVKR